MNENSSELMQALAFRQAAYAPPFRSPPLHYYSHRGDTRGGQGGVPHFTNHLTFDSMPAPPTAGQMAAMQPQGPPRQDIPSLPLDHPGDEDSSSVSSGSGPLDYPPFHNLTGFNQTYHAMMEWKLRHQSKRLRKKIRAMRNEMKMLYEAIRNQMTMMSSLYQTSSSSTGAPAGAPTALWCLVVGLVVGFVFLLVLLILCWTRVTKADASSSTQKT
jgi:hypothetical protein